MSQALPGPSITDSDERHKTLGTICSRGMSLAGYLVWALCCQCLAQNAKALVGIFSGHLKIGVGLGFSGFGAPKYL